MSKDAPEYFAVEADLREIAIVASRFNSKLVDSLIASVVETLTSCGVSEDNIEVVRVPGANEIPYAASMLARTEEHDVIIALGVVIAGQTDHHTVIAESTGHALQQVSINEEIPVINGIITVGNLEQAEARINGDYQRGVDFARSALEMAQVSESLEDRIFDKAFDFSEDDLETLRELDDSDEGDEDK